MARRKREGKTEQNLDDESPKGYTKRKILVDAQEHEFTLTGDAPNALILMTEFEEWLESIKDIRTHTRIANRLVNVQRRIPGDCESVGEGVYELRMHFGAGYRAYFGRHGVVFFILLGGGDKSSQSRDIAPAQEKWKVIRNGIKEI